MNKPITDTSNIRSLSEIRANAKALYSSDLPASLVIPMAGDLIVEGAARHYLEAERLSSEHDASSKLAQVTEKES